MTLYRSRRVGGAADLMQMLWSIITAVMVFLGFPGPFPPPPGITTTQAAKPDPFPIPSTLPGPSPAADPAPAPNPSAPPPVAEVPPVPTQSPTADPGPSPGPSPVPPVAELPPVPTGDVPPPVTGDPPVNTKPPPVQPPLAGGVVNGADLWEDPSDQGLSTYGHSAGVWLLNGGGDADRVKTIIAQAAGKTPILIQYSIPNRDNGGASSGGASGGDGYVQGIRANAEALGGKPAIIILEPDALPEGKDPQLIKQAVQTYKRLDPAALVYVDIGHHKWKPAQEAANLLKQAGLDEADGFSSNVSNYHATADEKAYGDAILAALGPDYAGKIHVIDTSRNKNGEGLDNSGNPAWGDPVRSMNGPVETGLPPGTKISDHTLALWVKRPGEGDGPRFAAGSYVGTQLAKPGNS